MSTHVRSTVRTGLGTTHSASVTDIPGTTAAPPLDLGLALAAGPLVWRQPDAPVEGSAFVSAIGLLGLVTSAVGALATMSGPVWSSRVLPAVGLLVSLVLLAVPLGVFLVDGRPIPLMSDRPGAAIALRAMTITCFVTSWLLIAQRHALPLFASLSTYLAADLSLSAWQLGTPVQAINWAKRTLWSWPNLGVIVAVGLAVALGSTVGVALASAGGGYLMLFLAFAEAQVLDHLRVRTATGRSNHDKLALADEHRRRSHWLHDDVLSLVTGVQMKLERDDLSQAEVARELGELDHQLRLRQADEQLRSGSATLGQLVQPYLRQAQNMGVRLVETPTSETASLRFAVAQARRAQRVLGVTIPNSVQAGATTIAVRFNAGPRHLDIEVEDDAGGFDVDHLPAGRGLSVLIEELRPEDNLRLEPTEAGTRVIAHLTIMSEETT